ncbi:hypothetical protein K492DRAFT_236516 [Lichtheimia hyalospora FSU 10163]|nr:hypothetical protein K492DRAFT_236516 [Lichtheimia hyalospora FSU 10163]
MPRRLRTSILSLVLFITTLSTGQNIQYATRFPKNKLYDLSPSSTGLDTMDGTVAAFGDFNGDKYTDLFVLSDDQHSLSVYTWHHQNFTFIPPRITPQITVKEFVITGVIPGDFTYDGNLDVLLLGQTNPRDSQSEIMMRIYPGNGNDTFDDNYITLPSAKSAHPMVVDLNGDMKLDLLGYSADGESGLNMWINNADPSTPANASSSMFNVSSASGMFDAALTNQCTWAHPHSNAMVDLDGDCMGDLVFVCQRTGYQTLQLWLNQREGGFKMADELQLPSGAGPVSFADIDGDGSADIVFPVNSGSKQEIHIVYNQQMGLCSQPNSGNTTTCRKPNQLCHGDPDFKFDMSHPDNENYVILDLKKYISSGESIQTMDTAFQGQLPVPVQPGDYNLDGYPDLLVTTNKQVLLLENTVCNNRLCSSRASQAGRRTFTIVKDGTDALTKISRPKHATFFDIDEDGSLDILVLQQSGGGSSSARVPRFIINNFFNDAFFLKGLVSNGVCGSNCDGNKPYGVNYPGATLKFTVLDTSGTKRAHLVSQLAQTSYMSLQTPYCLVGLGRTNNYVEEMFAGVSRRQDQNYLFYEGVIPNSQLIFIPYQPENVHDSSTWEVELYIQPGDYVPWVLAILIAAACILGIVVAVLYWMEKREDEMERRKALHIINFDAL